MSRPFRTAGIMEERALEEGMKGLWDKVFSRLMTDCLSFD